MAHCHFLVPVFGWTGTAPTLLNKQTNKPKQGYAGITPIAWMEFKASANSPLSQIL